MAIQLVIRASSAVGIFEAVVTPPSDQAPIWDTDINEPGHFTGDVIDIELDDLCVDPEGNPLLYTITGTLPSGLTQSGDRGEFITGTLQSAGVVSIFITADDAAVIPPSSDWEDDSTAVGVQIAENFDIATYPNRPALMAHLLAIEPLCPDNGVHYPYTGIAFGGTGRYDPVPVGQTEKIGLDTTEYVTGGQSVYMKLNSSEGPNDNGPVIELPNLTPTPIYYVRLVYKLDAAVLNWAYGGSHAKIFYLNNLDFSDGQIVGVLYNGSTPWPIAYRVDGSNTRQLRVQHNSVAVSGWGGSTHQLFGGYDSNPGAAYPTTASAFNQRFGPGSDFSDPASSDFALINRPTAGVWYQTEWMVDQSYVGSFSRGMFKSWGAPVGSAPQLQQMNYRDCGFDDFSETQCNSVRLVFRPENATTPGMPTGGIKVDSVIVSSNPINFIGGFALPNSGQTIPTGQPPANSVDD